MELINLFNNKNYKEIIQNELESNLENFNKFYNLVHQHNTYAIDFKKAKLKIDSLIINYCKEHKFLFIDNIIYLESNIPDRSKKEINEEKLNNLKEELIKTDNKKEELLNEIFITEKNLILNYLSEITKN